MCTLIMKGKETTYTDAEDPGENATPAMTSCSVLQDAIPGGQE
jgi:hypothetical protein